jgi:probable addiction module antidote protein
MPLATGKTIKRATTSASTLKTSRAITSAAPRSRDYKLDQHAWLRASSTNAAAFLEAALETGDHTDLMAALRDIADAHGGVAEIARLTGLSRETLYRTLSKKGNPQLSSLIPILNATGLRLAIAPIENAAQA